MMNRILIISVVCFVCRSLYGQNQKVEEKEIPHLHIPYEQVKIASAQNKSAPIIVDSDNDGVRDEFDKELNSPQGFPVNVFGVSIDSDKDGCLDAEDPEPLSSSVLPIDNCVTVIQTICGYKCGGSSGFTDWCIPSLHFEKDSAVIAEGSIIYLRSVFELMDRYPKLKMAIIGNSTLYSDEVITLERIKFVTQYLLDKGISEERMIIMQNKYNDNNSTTDKFDSFVAFDVIQ